jgi:hypothetical protein
LEPDDARRIFWARFTVSIVVGVPLVLMVYAWLLVRRGLAAGLLGGGLMCFSPTVLAHTSLATTDACFALYGLLALAALASYGREPTLGRYLVAATAIGAAVAAKYSGLFLFPVAAIVVVVLAYRRVKAREQGPPSGSSQACAAAAASSSPLGLEAPATSWRAHGRPVASAAGSLAALVYLAFMVAWALHLFAFARIGDVTWFSDPSTPAWVRSLADIELPAPVVGVIAQYLHNLSGHGAYLMGEWSTTGWWYYFPCAAFFKSTPVELVLALGLVVWIVAWLKRVGRTAGGPSPRPSSQGGEGGGETRPRDWSRLVWWSGLVIYALMMLNVRVQIGHRYLLPLYPLVILIAVDAGAELAKKRPKLLSALGTLLLAGQFVSAWSVAPHYLAYFSPLVGGPTNGAKLLVDSNLDWGQDLPSLRTELEGLGYSRVLLYYFGTASPEAYGVQATAAQPQHLAQWENFDAIAVSLTKLHGAPPFGEPRLHPLKNVRPIARAGYSIVIFDAATARRAMRERRCRSSWGHS